jgi:iron-sulfur cluster repair protein YtfE (RIC family)
MAFKKKTLRRMSPTARKVARLAGELDSISRRLKNLIPELQQLDLDSQALKNARAIYPEKTDYQGLGLDQPG